MKTLLGGGGGGGGTPPVIITRYQIQFKILKSRYPFRFGGQKLNQLMQTIENELSSAQEKINQLYNIRYILGSSGDELDLHGEVLACLRQVGESDNDYRARLLNALRDIQKTLTIRALKDALEATCGFAPICYEHYHNIPGLKKYSLLPAESSIPYFTWPASLYDYSHLLIASFIIGNYNYIQNSGFETGTWGGEEIQTDEEKYKGNYSAKIIADGSSRWVFSGLSNPISVLPGQYTYTVSVHQKITSNEQGVLLFQVKFYDAQDNYLGYMDWGVAQGVHYWQRLQYTFSSQNFPDGTAKVRFQFLWCETGGNPIGIAYIDNYKFEISDVPTEDWSESEYLAMEESLQNVKLATLKIYLVEDSGQNYYILRKVII